jgi:hypothetical protein
MSWWEVREPRRPSASSNPLVQFIRRHPGCDEGMCTTCGISSSTVHRPAKDVPEKRSPQESSGPPPEQGRLS